MNLDASFQLTPRLPVCGYAPVGKQALDLERAAFEVKGAGVDLTGAGLKFVGRRRCGHR